MCYQWCGRLWGEPVILARGFVHDCPLGLATFDAHISAAFISCLFSRLCSGVVSTWKWTRGSCMIGEWFMHLTTTPTIWHVSSLFAALSFWISSVNCSSCLICYQRIYVCHSNIMRQEPNIIMLLTTTINPFHQITVIRYISREFLITIIREDIVLVCIINFYLLLFTV